MSFRTILVPIEQHNLIIQPEHRSPLLGERREEVEVGVKAWFTLLDGGARHWKLRSVWRGSLTVTSKGSLCALRIRPPTQWPIRPQ